MYKEEIFKMAQAAKNKVAMFEGQLLGYFIHSAMAGIYVGFGIVLIVILGAPFYSSHSPLLALVMGASFGLALSLVMLAGSDLFTGNTMVLPIGGLAGSISWRNVVKLLFFNYIGNFLGSLFLAYLVANSDIFSDEISLNFLLTLAKKKMGLDFYHLFIRGILCNWLVTLSVWCCYKMKTESGKLIMVFWCLLGFIGSGYEHSVANMTLLSLANFVPHQGDINWLGLLHNLIPVTLGNLVSGFLFMACSYWWIAHGDKKKNEAF